LRRILHFSKLCNYNGVSSYLSLSHDIEVVQRLNSTNAYMENI